MALYLGANDNVKFVTLDGYTLQDSEGLSLIALPVVAKRKIIINNVVYRVILNLKGSE